MPASKNSARARVGPSVSIPDKLYFRIGEVSKLCGLPPYVLRFWESEFPQLRPAKGATGQRMYRRKHVECILRIKQLLYGEGFTIAGARQQLREEGRQEASLTLVPPPAAAVPGPEPDLNGTPSASLHPLREELLAILGILNAKPARGTPRG